MERRRKKKKIVSLRNPRHRFFDPGGNTILKNRNKVSREINADFWNLEAEEEEEFLNSNVAY